MLGSWAPSQRIPKGSFRLREEAEKLNFKALIRAIRRPPLQPTMINAGRIVNVSDGTALSSAKQLVAMVSPDMPDVYRQACRWLLDGGESFAVGVLKELETYLSSKDQGISVKNARECSYFLEYLVETLVKEPGSLNRAIFTAACTVQFQYGDSHNAVHWTKECFKRIDPSAAYAAVETMERLAGKKLCWHVSYPGLIESLGAINSPLIKEYLQGKLASSELETRTAAIVTLGTLEDPSVFDYVLPFLRDPEAEIRQCALEALYCSDWRRSARAARGLADDCSLTVRVRAVQLMGLAGDPDSLPLLAAKLEVAPERAVRLCAAKSIGLIKPAVPPPELIRALDDADPAVRGMTAWALGEIGSAAALRPLEALAGDVDPFTSWSAADAKVKIQSGSAES
jgi:HEAT repeats